MRQTSITKEQVDAWCGELKLNKNALAQIKHILTADPVRRVSNVGGVSGSYPSPIINAALQWEGHAELRFLDLAHYAETSRILLDQPCILPIEITLLDGKQQIIHHIPDFFWMTLNWAGYVECKTESKLKWEIDPENPKSQPGRYTFEDGKWRSRPGEKAAAAQGLEYKLFVTTTKDAVLINNLRFLADYLGTSNGPLEATIIDKVRGMLPTEGLEIREVISRLEQKEVDPLYFAIAHRRLYVDLERDPIAPNYTARIYLNGGCSVAATHRQAANAAAFLGDQLIVALQPGSKFDIAGTVFDIVGLAGDVVRLRNPEATSILEVSELFKLLVSGKAKAIASSGSTISTGLSALAQAEWDDIDPQEWPGINARYQQLEPYLLQRRGNRGQLAAMNRTIFRYQERFRQAEDWFGPGCGILGLRQKIRKGRPGCRIDQRVCEIVDSVIQAEYLRTGTAPTAEFVDGGVVTLCEEHVPPLTAPSRKFVYKRIHALNREDATRARDGSKAAEKFRAPVWEDDWDGEEIDGNYALGVCHVDHTQVDITTPPTPDGLSLGRPWITVMITPRHTLPLAVTISYEQPGYRACMRVVRECIRRHGRVPAVVVTDNGSEFRSEYFRTLLHRLGCKQMFRPPSTPRFGAKLERLMGTVNHKLLYNLPGNTRLTKRVRELTPEVDPEKHAVWPLKDLKEIITDFYYDFVPNRPHPITGVTPLQLFDKDLRLGGTRAHTLIVYTEQFEIWTMPTTDSGVVKVKAREGITVNGIPYWRAEFAKMVGQELHVRYDPDDLSTVYVRIAGKWVPARCRAYQAEFTGLTEKERTVMTQLIRQSAAQGERRRRITGAALYQFIRNRRTDSAIALVHARAAANKTASSDIIVTPHVAGSKRAAEIVPHPNSESIDAAEPSDQNTTNNAEADTYTFSRAGSKSKRRGSP